MVIALGTHICVYMLMTDRLIRMYASARHKMKKMEFWNKRRQYSIKTDSKIQCILASSFCDFNRCLEISLGGKRSKQAWWSFCTTAACKNTSLPIVICGGAGNMMHLAEAFSNSPISGIACSSIFHFGDNNPIRARSYLKNLGIPMRTVK